MIIIYKITKSYTSFYSINLIIQLYFVLSLFLSHKLLTLLTFPPWDLTILSWVFFFQSSSGVLHSHVWGILWGKGRIIENIHVNFFIHIRFTLKKRNMRYVNLKPEGVTAIFSLKGIGWGDLVTKYKYTAWIILE